MGRNFENMFALAHKQMAKFAGLIVSHESFMFYLYSLMCCSYATNTPKYTPATILNSQTYLTVTTLVGIPSYLERLPLFVSSSVSSSVSL